MAESFDTNVSSASTDDAVGQPKRCAHGSEIGEAVCLGGTMKAREAFMEFVSRMAPGIAMRFHSVTTPESFTISARWHHRQKAYAATLTCEAGRANA
jgi:hypothetical protein